MNEDEDLLYVGKTTLWRIGYDLYNSSLHTTGMSWPEVWKTLTGEEAPIRSILPIQSSVDFVNCIILEASRPTRASKSQER